MQNKKALRKQLFMIGEQWLESQGYTVARAGMGKGSVRRISKKGSKSLLAAIRTTRDGHIAFDPKPDVGFSTLDEVEVVIAVASDDWESPNPKNPKNAFVHHFDAEVLRRDHFNRARDARTAAGKPPAVGIGMWLALYRNENPTHVGTIGYGFGNKYPPVQKVSLAETAHPVQETVEERVEERTADHERLTLKEGTPIKLDVGGVRITIEITAA